MRVEQARLTQRPRRQWLAAVAFLGLSLAVLLVVAGTIRYDGLDGLWLRARAEFAPRRDHPQLVPTPLPTPAGQGAQALLIASPSPTASPTLVQTPAARLWGTRGHDTQLRLARGAEAALAGITVQPTATPTPLPTPTALPTATPVPPPPAQAPAGTVVLSGIKHAWQTWNNCGPATLSMAMSYYDSPVVQAEAARVLKPNKDDKNVSPEQMAEFARSQGLNALLRVDGDTGRLRQMVSAGVPVLIETWLEHDGGMGHYRLVTGYDDAAGEWILYDSYVSDGIDPKQPYPGIRIPYGELERLWRVFNNTYIVLHDAQRAALVQEIMGSQMDDATMWQGALERAQAEAQAVPGDAFAWFNLGSSLVALGRHGEAAIAFDQARVIGLPWRMLWYQFGPFEAYFESGRYDELIALADATIATAGNIEETFFWKGKGLQAKGDLDGARQSYRRAVELNSNYPAAQQALAELGG